LEKPVELIVEISWSSVMYDRHEKYALYERFGIEEYIICEMNDQRVSWFNLQDSGYRSLTEDSEGLIKSVRLPGLWLNASAIMTGNMAKVLADVERGFASVEFRAFLAKPTGQRGHS
jgi:Uma2 family endonuclease